MKRRKQCAVSPHMFCRWSSAATSGRSSKRSMRRKKFAPRTSTWNRTAASAKSSSRFRNASFRRQLDFVETGRLELRIERGQIGSRELLPAGSDIGRGVKDIGHGGFDGGSRRRVDLLQLC